MLDTGRARLPYADVLLYFLDPHAYIPEVLDATGRRGFWVGGDGRADILVRADAPIDHIRMTAETPIATEFIVSMGGPTMRFRLVPGTPLTFYLPASGVRDYSGYAYLLSARSTEGFTPHLQESSSLDYRNLGVQVAFTPVHAGAVP